MRQFKLRRVFGNAEIVIAKIEAFLASAGSFGVPVILFLIAGNVLGRSIGTPLIFSNEISVYMMIPVVFLACADTLRRGEHVRAEVLIRRLAPGIRKVVEIIGELAALVITVLILISCWQLAIDSYVHNELSSTLLRTPLYIPRILLAIGFSLFTLESAIRVIRSFLCARKV